MAGRMRCRTRPPSPVPAPIAGNQPSRTANTQIRTMAATKLGTAWPITVASRTPLSSRPLRSPATRPRLTPPPTISTEAMATSSAVVAARDPMRSATPVPKASDWPGLPRTRSPSHARYRVRNGSSRWYWWRRAWTASGGRVRPPDSVATGSPGARYSDEKTRKLEASRVSRSPASLLTSDRGILFAPRCCSGSAHVGRPGGVEGPGQADRAAGDLPAHPGQGGHVDQRDQHHVVGEHHPLGLGHQPGPSGVVGLGERPGERPDGGRVAVVVVVRPPARLRDRPQGLERLGHVGPPQRQGEIGLRSYGGIVGPGGVLLDGDGAHLQPSPSCRPTSAT